jgi:hypothetical protein
MVSSSWRRTSDGINLKVTVPANSQAKVSIPTLGLQRITVDECGEIIWKQGAYSGNVRGITGGNRSDRYLTFDVGSGQYNFRLGGITPKGTE